MLRRAKAAGGSRRAQESTRNQALVVNEAAGELSDTAAVPARRAAVGARRPQHVLVPGRAQPRQASELVQLVLVPRVPRGASGRQKRRRRRQRLAGGSGAAIPPTARKARGCRGCPVGWDDPVGMVGTGSEWAAPQSPRASWLRLPAQSRRQGSGVTHWHLKAFGHHREGAPCVGTKTAAHLSESRGHFGEAPAACDELVSPLQGHELLLLLSEG